MHQPSAKRPSSPRGFTLVEVIIASCILMYTMIGVMTGLNLGCVLAKRAHHETICELRCVDRLEEIMTATYSNILSYPIEYSNLVGNTLEWTMTTIVTEVTNTPLGESIMYKRINVYAGWNTFGGKNKYTTFVLIRSPLSLKSAY